jgi:N,N'-diacetyllegionaminate synthase
MTERMIIAEMANAHEGDPEKAKTIAKAAAEAGASAIKFQVFEAAELAVPAFPYFELYEKLEMPDSVWASLVDLSHGLGLTVYCDVFGLSSAERMFRLGVDGFMIHAADIPNTELLVWVAASGRSILLSGGGSTWVEIVEAVECLRARGAQSVSLMHGFQGFPTPLQRAYLQRIPLLREKTGVPIGFASHLAGDDPMAATLPAWAVAAGADLIEVHLTLDRSQKGLDYFSSLEPNQFAEMVRLVRACEQAIGPRSMTLSQEEVRYRQLHRKYMVSTRELHKGDILTSENTGLRRVKDPPEGVALGRERALGHQSAIDLPAFSTIQSKDVKMKIAATLACRAESSRMYGKPMQLVGDRPIIQHLIDRLLQAKSIDEVVLAITEGPSSAIFIDYARRKSLPYILGPEIDVLQRLIMAAEHVKADIVVRVTPDNPFIYWENLDEIIAEHIERNADLTVTEKLPLGSVVEIISLDALKRSHARGEDRHRSELCTLFISENPDLFSIQRLSPPSKFQRPEIRLTVDTPYDLIMARNLWQALQQEGHLISIEEIIEFLDLHPDLAAINKTDEKTLHLWK